METLEQRIDAIKMDTNLLKDRLKTSNNLNRYWVYKLTSPSGKVYIGITSNIILRFQAYRHIKNSTQPLVSKAIEKYGWDCLNKEILHCFITKQQAFDLEIKYISEYKKLRISLNVSDGGDLGSGLFGRNHPASRKVCQFDKDGNYLTTFDSIASAVRSIGSTSKSSSPIHKACSERTYFSNGFLWCYESDYLKFGSPVYHPPTWDYLKESIVQFDLNLNVIEIHASITEAAKSVPCKQFGISNCLFGRKQQYKNFVWMYKRDYDLGIRPNPIVTKIFKPHTKPVLKFSKSGELLEEYPSILSASKNTGIDTGTIIRSLKGRTKSREFIWKYKQIEKSAA